MKAIIIFLIFGIPLLQASGDQDQKVVKGQIRDQNGDPLPGISVLEKGTTNGTITDIDGMYTLEVDPNSTLVLSSIGYSNVELNVQNKDIINYQFGSSISLWCCTDHEKVHCDSEKKVLKEEFGCKSFRAQ